MSARYDPHLATFERIGDPNTALGTTLVLRYGDDLIFESNATLGIRRKFLLPSHGLIIKAECVPTGSDGAPWVSQAESEWEVYQRLPRHLVPHFQPLRTYRHDTIRAPQPGDHPDATCEVYWVAQDWCEGRTGCSYIEFKDRWIAAEAAGFRPHDHKPDQLRTRPDGHIVWLDWGHWSWREQPTTDHR